MRKIIITLMLILAPMQVIALDSLYWMLTGASDTIYESIPEIDEPMDEDYIPLEYAGEYELTAYCSCTICCSEGLGITATGTTPAPGRTISVDSDLIPLGSQVYIEGMGIYTAEDTGSAIKGNIIDLYMANHDEALQFGRKTREVYICGTANTR